MSLIAEIGLHTHMLNGTVAVCGKVTVALIIVK